MARLDLAGRRINSFTVLWFEEVRRRASYWRCRCDCGTEKTLWGADLARGRPLSCGCIDFVTTHGKTKSPEYESWHQMKSRCLNPNNKSFSRYGGRGIKVCKRWVNSFENFLADIGERPSKFHSIERVNNNGNYSPSNCVWLLLRSNVGIGGLQN